MLTSVRFLGIMVSSMTILTAMLYDAPNEMAEILSAPWTGWFQIAESSADSCLLTELGQGYGEMFDRLKKDLVKFYAMNRSEERIPAAVLDEGRLSLEQLVSRRGFNLEVHEVDVGDGWTVSIHRILHPVYILADAGFDVWMGNYRGSSLFASHKQKQPLPGEQVPDSPWAFTVNDLALYDMPKQIDYILNATGHSRLHLVGMSQGSISGLQMFSLRPDYNDKVISFASLAGARALESVGRIPLIKYVSCIVARHMPPQEFLSWNENLVNLMYGAEPDALALLKDIIGLTVDYIDTDQAHLVMKYVPAGTSTWVIQYYYQLWNSTQSKKIDAVTGADLIKTFDYGPEGNLRRFNSKHPTWMNISHLRVPTKLYFSSGDAYCTENENRKLLKALPAETTEHMFVDDDRFSHYNFAINDKDTRVFKDVVAFLKKHRP